MRNLIAFGMAVALTCLLTVVPGSRVFAEDEIVIQVAPGTILLGADQANQVTVHAEIPYSIVDTGSVKLNGLTPTATWYDDCGELVARFASSEVEALEEVKPKEVLLTLSGTTKEGGEFSGSDIVRVVNFSGTDDPPGK